LRIGSGAPGSSRLHSKQTEVISVPFEEVMELLLKKPELVAVLVDVFCRALKQDYLHVNILSMDETIQRLMEMLNGLASKIAGGRVRWSKFQPISHRRK
jgi:CRP-like cAMP-binding protein